MQTLSLSLKNICTVKNTKAYAVAYAQCSWITEVSNDVLIIKNFIMNHFMRLAMFNNYFKMKLFAVAETRFASWIIMLKRFKFIKRNLQDLILSDQWNMYMDDDVEQTQFIKEKVLDDLWRDKINYFIAFTNPIYDMIWVTDTDTPFLHLVCDMWDITIEKKKGKMSNHLFMMLCIKY